jgi:hypothetical protein
MICAPSPRGKIEGNGKTLTVVQPNMRLVTLVALISLVLTGCQPSSPPTEPQRGAGADQERAGQPARSFDGWTIRISLQPDTVGPIALDVGPIRPAQENAARPWIQHEIEFHNRGARPVRFRDTRVSLFLAGTARRVLLAADEGCGYEKPRNKPVRAGACLLYLDAFAVRPGATVRRTITLFRDLRGMEPLLTGTYVWDKVIQFHVGKADAAVRTATIRLTYELSPAGG